MHERERVNQLKDVVVQVSLELKSLRINLFDDLDWLILEVKCISDVDDKSAGEIDSI